MSQSNAGHDSDKKRQGVTWDLDKFDEDSPTKKHRAFVCRLRILKVAPPSSQTIRPMPLECDSNLPAILMRLGQCDESEVQVSFNLDTCAGMNTGNLRIHQYLITTFPTCVHSYEEYNDSNPFSPISLEGVTTDSSSSEDFESGKLTALVRYHTRYSERNGTKKLLSFGLGESVAVNGLIGLPTLRDWKMVIDLDDNLAFSKNLCLKWKLEFNDAARGLPTDVAFKSSNFVRPMETTDTGMALATIIKVPSSAPLPPVPSENEPVRPTPNE